MDLPCPRLKHTTEEPRRHLPIGGNGFSSAALVRHPTIITSIPAHLLRHMLSFLDRPSLCTARLVCKAFCQAASENIRTLRLPLPAARIAPRHGLNRFPVLEAVQCSMDLAELRTGIPDWLEEHVTAVTIKEFKYRHHADDFQRHELELAILATLRLPRLTSLDVSVSPACDFFHKACDTSMASATQLRRFSITSLSAPLLELVAQLTHLTMLHFEGNWPRKNVRPDIRELSTLRHLRELGLQWRGRVHMFPHQFSGLQGLTWIVSHTLVDTDPSSVDPRAPFLNTMTGLRSLELYLRTEQQLADLLSMSRLCALTLHSDSTDGLGYISLEGAHALSRLTSLGIVTRDHDVGVGVSEGGFPALQQLSLDGLRKDDLKRLAPLFQPSITQLVLVEVSRTPLSNLLSRLPNLQALGLSDVRAGRVVSLLPGNLRRLTELVMIDTRLKDQHARYFRRLHDLRSLVLIHNVEVTAGFLSSLTGLTRLSMLKLWYCHALLPADVLTFCSQIDAARAEYGWPPLEVVPSPIPLESPRNRSAEGVDAHDARHASSDGADLRSHGDGFPSDDDNDDDDFSRDVRDHDLSTSDEDGW